MTKYDRCTCEDVCRVSVNAQMAVLRPYEMSEMSKTSKMFCVIAVSDE